MRLRHAEERERLQGWDIALNSCPAFWGYPSASDGDSPVFPKRLPSATSRGSASLSRLCGWCCKMTSPRTSSSLPGRSTASASLWRNRLCTSARPLCEYAGSTCCSLTYRLLPGGSILTFPSHSRKATCTVPRERPACLPYVSNVCQHPNLAFSNCISVLF